MEGLLVKEILLLFLAFVSSCQCNIERILVNDTNIDDINSARFGNEEAWPHNFGGGQKILNKAAVCDDLCGLPYKSDDEDDDERIIGGTETGPNQFPWMVLLQIKVSNPFKEDVTMCGATIIKKQFLLTAAHCVYHPKVKSIEALIGFHYVNLNRFKSTGNEMKIPIAKLYMHENFNPEVMENDMAILELAMPLKFTDQVHSICLPDENMKKIPDGTQLVTAGWGVTKAFGSKFLPQMLLSVSLPVINNKDCRESYGEDGKFIRKSSICAGGHTKNSCQGDSGGPLMLSKPSRNSKMRYSQVGIVSFGARCDMPGMPGVYSRVSKQLAWIKSITGKKDPCTPLPPN